MAWNKFYDFHILAWYFIYENTKIVLSLARNKSHQIIRSSPCAKACKLPLQLIAATNPPESSSSLQSLFTKSAGCSSKPNQRVHAVSSGVDGGQESVEDAEKRRGRRKALKVARKFSWLYELVADTAIFHAREPPDKFTPHLLRSLVHALLVFPTPSPVRKLHLRLDVSLPFFPLANRLRATVIDWVFDDPTPREPLWCAVFLRRPLACQMEKSILKYFCAGASMAVKTRTVIASVPREGLLE